MHLWVAWCSMLDIWVRSMRKADCGTVAASRQATCARSQQCVGHFVECKTVCALEFHGKPTVIRMSLPGSELTRVKMRSVRPMRAALAGTNDPTWARKTISATCFA